MNTQQQADSNPIHDVLNEYTRGTLTRENYKHSHSNMTAYCVCSTQAPSNLYATRNWLVQRQRQTMRCIQPCAQRSTQIFAEKNNGKLVPVTIVITIKIELEGGSGC